jgi:hypothetical protein
MELRPGEQLVTVAGGKCNVCKKRIEPGKAVQVSAYSNAIRHPECLPETDQRDRPRREKITKEIEDVDA